MFFCDSEEEIQSNMLFLISFNVIFRHREIPWQKKKIYFKILLKKEDLNEPFIFYLVSTSCLSLLYLSWRQMLHGENKRNLRFLTLLGLPFLLLNPTMSGRESENLGKWDFINGPWLQGRIKHIFGYYVKNKQVIADWRMFLGPAVKEDLRSVPVASVC